MENIIHSFWSLPSIKKKTLEHDRNNGGFLSEKYHAMSWALSCLSWKKYYGKISLYTDVMGKEWLIDKLNLPYDEVYICLDEINNINPIYYAYPKLYVYSLQEKPFLHVDGDTYIFNKLPVNYKNSELVCQSFEYNFSFYGKVLKQVRDNLINIPKEIYSYDSTNFQAINAGIIGGKNVTFFKELFQLVKQVFYDNNVNSDLIDIERYNVLMEQFYFYMLANKKGLKIDTLLNYEISENFRELTMFHMIPIFNSYIHLISFSKRQYLHFLQLENRLKAEFYDVYKKISFLYKEPPHSFPKITSKKTESNSFNSSFSFIKNELNDYNPKNRKRIIETYLEKNLVNESVHAFFVYDLYQIEDFIFNAKTNYSRKDTEKEIYDNILILNKNKNISDLGFKINSRKGELIFLNFDYSNYDITNDIDKIVSDFNNNILNQTKPTPYFIFIQDDDEGICIKCKKLTGWNLLYYYLDDGIKTVNELIDIVYKSEFLNYEGDDLKYDLMDFLLSNAVYHSYLKIENNE